MRHHISNTAEFGDYTRGERIINRHSLTEMQNILAEIQTGQFARQWMEESESGGQWMTSKRKTESQLELENAGRTVRELIAKSKINE